MTADYEFLSGAGEMAARMRSTDWSRTPLGPVERWPESLRSALSICIGSRFPIAIYWGERLTLLYNDAWSPIPGTKHPWALGRDAREVWPEIWNTIGPLFEHVQATGEATYSEDSLLPMHRHGYTEECYFNFTFTPIRGAGGRVEGVFNAVIETTYRVISERRTRALRELNEATAGAKSRAEACALAARSLAAAAADVTFCAIYLTDESGRVARRVAVANVPPEAPLAPANVPLAGDDEAPWPFARVAQSADVAAVNGLVERFGYALPGGPWPEPTDTALVAPLTAGAASGVAGFLVLGASPRRAVDDDYRQFAQRAADNINRVVSTAAALEAERRRAEALAELDRAKTAFFSNVSHEFRTPLTLMLAPLEDTLAAADRLAPQDRERLALAHRNATRLLKLVNTLLDFSRIEAGRMEASYEATDLAGFTAELASMFRSAVERAGLRYVVDCAPIGEPAYVDRDMWEKIVLNLISNAFKFTLEGEIEVALRREGDRAVLAVRDTGCGIPREALARVFERFHRVKGLRGRTFEGSGIGLALVQELVKLHAGEVSVESEVDRGSRFTVAIPLGTAHLPPERIGSARMLPSTSVRAEAYVDEAWRWLPAEAQAGAPAAVAAAGTPSGRIVLADDNADMREYIRRLLAERYEVVAVEDGLAALAAAREARPDLVLTDVMMPRLDGFGLLARLRADQTLGTVPVIMLSARAGEEARVEGMAAGADDYLVKPFSAKELLARVAAHVQLARLRRAVAQREQALRAEAQAATERFELVLAGVTDQFFVLDREWRYVFVNDRVGEVTGRPREALLGRSIWSVFPELAGSEFERRLRAAVARNAPTHFEYRYAPLSRWFENRIYPFASGVSVFVADITDRKRAEEEVRESEERFRAIVETTPECVKLVAADGTLLQMNSVGLAMVGADTAESVVGQCVYELIAPEHREAFRTFNERVCRGEKGALEFDVVGLRGVRRHVETRAAPLRRPGGDTVHLAVTRDVTERRRVQEALEEADRRKDEFLATLAHELRNPLAPLRNALHILRMRGATDAEARIHETMERQVNHLVRLVDDLLEMSRISRGAFELRKERVELGAIVNAAVETSGPLMEAAGHRITVELPVETLWLEGDPVRLVQILANLLNNAARYTGRGGDVRVQARREAEGVVIAVRDNGAGIAPDMLERIFEMFSRGDPVSVHAHGGLGVGLALARKLAQMHGGTVEGYSEGPGRGSEFVVRLPLAPPPQRLEGTPAPRRSGPCGGKRIMVVDDNPDAADTLALLLECLGAEVRVALGGAMALRDIEAYHPAVVLLDIGMPEMDGYEVARRIRARFPGPRPTLVALTGWGQDADRRRAREAGFDHHLVKPVEIAALQALLADLDAAGARTA